MDVSDCPDVLLYTFLNNFSFFPLIFLARFFVNGILYSCPKIPDHHTIDIELIYARDGQQYTLTAADTGVGYPESVLPRDKRGGLGLRLVELFTEQLDGHIVLASDGRTRVTITFPATNC